MKMSSVGHVGTGTKVSGVSQIAWLNKDSDRSPQLTDGKKKDCASDDYEIL